MHGVDGRAGAGAAATILRWLRRHWFIAGLVIAAGLGFLVPEVGARGGPLRTGITTKAGVAIIFLLQGLALSPAALRSGALRWRLHATTQLFIFGAFPAVVIALDMAAGSHLPPDLRLGFLFLAILPTTVSTCVVFTATARGNVSGAIFNAAFANVAGVVLTPLWATLLLEARGAAPPLLPMIGEIALLLLAPLVAGQLLRPIVRRFHEPHPPHIAAAANTIILFIVFAAFSNSVASGAFARTGSAVTLLVAFIAIALFAAATLAAALTGRRARLDAADRRTLLFCASQKTLAAGVPMGQILFADHAGLGLILLPLIVYHAVQLIAGASIAARLGERAADPRQAVTSTA